MTVSSTLRPHVDRHLIDRSVDHIEAGNLLVMEAGARFSDSLSLVEQGVGALECVSTQRPEVRKHLRIGYEVLANLAREDGRSDAALTFYRLSALAAREVGDAEAMARLAIGYIHSLVPYHPKAALQKLHRYRTWLLQVNNPDLMFDLVFLEAQALDRIGDHELACLAIWRLPAMIRRYPGVSDRIWLGYATQWGGLCIAAGLLDEAERAHLAAYERIELDHHPLRAYLYHCARLELFADAGQVGDAERERECADVLRLTHGLNARILRRATHSTP